MIEEFAVLSLSSFSVFFRMRCLKREQAILREKEAFTGSYALILRVYPRAFKLSDTIRQVRANRARIGHLSVKRVLKNYSKIKFVAVLLPPEAIFP